MSKRSFITERKRAEDALQRINRELRAISECNQTLLRATDEQTLVSDICRIVCEEAGYRMAWVGYAEDDAAKSVRPVAWAGAEDGFLARVEVCWSEDTERGRGPTGTAIRSGKTCYIQDFTTDPRTAPWQEDALEHGYRSTIALPLKDEQGRVFGTLTIYSNKTNTFSPAEIRLLEELAGDLAFGITIIRARIKRDLAEEALALRSFALNNVGEAAFLIDENAHFLYVNEEACRSLGYTCAELLEMGVQDINPEFPSESWSINWADLRSNRSQTFESRHRAKNGHLFPIEINANYFEYGGRAYALALIRDITERKEAEQALKRSEFYLAEGQRLTHTGSWSWSPITRESLYWSEEMLRIFGLDPQKGVPTAETFWQRVHPEDFDCTYELLNNAARGNIEYEHEHRIVLPDRTVKHIHAIGHPVLDENGQVTEYMGTAVDVTDRKRAEEQLRQSEQLWRAVFSAANDGILVLDEQYNIVACNTAADLIYGSSPTGKNLRELRAPETLAQLDIQLSQAKEEGGARWETVHLRADGSRFPIEVSSRSFEANGNLRFVDIVRDITARKEAEDQLRNSEQRLALLIEQSPLGFLGWNSDFRLTEWNPAAERIFGYRKDEVFGRDVSFLVPDIVREAVDERIREVQTKKVVRRGTNENLTKDGRIILCDWCNAPLIDSQGHVIGAIALCEDVTAQRKLEEQLRQSQKMEAIGQLAGGVAHDFNNILGIINGYSESLLLERDLRETHRTSIEEVLAAGQRASSLTRQLLTFSRKLVLQPKALNLNSVIEGFEKMLRRLIGDEIEVRTMLHPNLSTVNADPNQIEQVLLNFCINARDAMSEGGRITIETANLELDDAVAAQHISLTPGQYVTLSVSDTGIGMDQETQSHIFEPFFTTKGPQRGTGLGLATVYGIVKQSGGHVSVYSEPGRGSTFRVYLPAVSQEIKRHDQIAAPQEELLSGSETVLLVEDAAPLRILYHKILEDRGYTVLEAGDGECAVQVSEQYQGYLALLLTDVSLPGMKGPTLAKILLQKRPTMKVLFMSGHNDDVVSGPNQLLNASTGFIQKPFGAEVMLRKMREMLGPQRPEIAA